MTSRVAVLNSGHSYVKLFRFYIITMIFFLLKYDIPER
jgi:hypothetical protein